MVRWGFGGVGVGVLALVAASVATAAMPQEDGPVVSLVEVDSDVEFVTAELVDRPDPNATPEEWENPSNLQWTTDVPKPINVPAYYGQQLVNGAQSVQGAVDRALKPLAGTGIPMLVHGSGLEGHIGQVQTAGTTLGGKADTTPPQQSPMQHMIGDTLSTLAPVVGLVNKPAGVAMEFAGNALSNSASATDRTAAAEARRYKPVSSNDYSRGQVLLNDGTGKTQGFPGTESSIPSISDSLLSGGGSGNKPGPSSIQGMDPVASLLPKPSDPVPHTPADSAYTKPPIDDFSDVRPSQLNAPSSMSSDVDTSAAGATKGEAGRQAKDVADAAAAAAKQEARDSKIKKQSAKAGASAAAAAAAAAAKQKQKAKGKSGDKQGAVKGSDLDAAEEKLETPTSNIKQKVTKALADDDKRKQKQKQKQKLKEKKKRMKQQKTKAKAKKLAKAKDKKKAKKKSPAKLKAKKKQPKRSPKKLKAKAKKLKAKAKKVKAKAKKNKAAATKKAKAKAKKTKARAKAKAKRPKAKRAPKRARPSAPKRRAAKRGGARRRGGAAKKRTAKGRIAKRRSSTRGGR